MKKLLSKVANRLKNLFRRLSDPFLACEYWIVVEYSHARDAVYYHTFYNEAEARASAVMVGKYTYHWYWWSEEYGWASQGVDIYPKPGCEGSQ